MTASLPPPAVVSAEAVPPAGASRAADPAVEGAPWSRPVVREVACVGLLIAFGAFLRFFGLGQMEFKGDEAAALELGHQLLASRPWATSAPWPQFSMTSSAGVGNPPLFTWVMAAFWWLTRSPVGATALVALVNVLPLPAIYLWARRTLGSPRALLVLGWLALAPYAVFYSRKLWTPELLLPGVAALLWGLDRWRAGRYWLAAGLLVWGGFIFFQVHLSSPFFLMVLASILAVDAVRRRRAGQLPPLQRPRGGELLLLASGLGVAAFFTFPYLAYLLKLSPEALRGGIKLAWPEPQLLIHLVKTLVPFELELHFAGQWTQFVHSGSPNALLAGMRWLGWVGAIYTAIPLMVRGVYGWFWGWARRPWILSVLGAAWLGHLVLFSALHLPAFPHYVLMLYPLPALLMAGALDVEAFGEKGGAARGWRALRWGHVILLGMLSLGYLTWVVHRGGAEGDYGIGYQSRQSQARAVIVLLEGGDPAPFETAARYMFQGCHPLEIEVRWIVYRLAPQHDHDAGRVRICEAWFADGRGDFEYRWALDR